jgi:arylsulfatase A-like enzyme
VGKWHLGFSPACSPVKNGFDYFFGLHGGGIDYISHRSPKNGAIDLYENEMPVQMDGYMTDLLRDKAIELINRPHEKPFLLALMFNAPHWPWQAPGDLSYPDTMNWVNGGSAHTFGLMMKSLDDAVGSIMQILSAQNLNKNTIVIFTSDNGGERYSEMGIYKGEKMQLWEGGIRVPAIVSWPGKIKAGTTSNQVLITMDWSASILSLARATFPANAPTDGINIMPVIMGKSKLVDRTLYWRLFQRTQQKAMRDGKWKYMKDEKGMEYLFDLSLDPAETHDQKEKEKNIFASLQKKYGEWESQMLAPVPLK